MTQQLKDIGWAFNRIDHMLFVYDHPDTIQGHLGLQESMADIREMLPKLTERYGFVRCWPEPKIAPADGAAKEKPL